MIGLQINLLLLIFAHLAIAEMRLSQMVHEDKTQYEIRGNQGEMAHKFGVEIVPNSQFHHTTTDEDGVRLGCYGHIQDGIKYSTLYVADKRGYRIVSHQGLIPVYPEYDVERQASFADQFDINEQLSRNIRHFFPDGCKHQSDLEAQGSAHEEDVQQRVLEPEQWQQRQPAKSQQWPQPEENQETQDWQQQTEIRPNYVNRQPPSADNYYSESRHGREFEEQTVVTPETIIVPPPAPTTTERPYPVYDRSKDPRYSSPTASQQPTQPESQESMQLNVIALPPKCDTGIQLYYFNQFVNQQNVCLKENCETVAIRLPIGTIHQNDLDQLNDIEVLEKVLDLLKKSDNRALRIMNQIRASE